MRIVCSSIWIKITTALWSAQLPILQGKQSRQFTLSSVFPVFLVTVCGQAKMYSCKKGSYGL